MKNRKLFFYPFLFAVTSLTLFFIAVFNHWFGMPTDVGGNFCEAAREGLIKQPANTWSNLGFVFFGLLMAWQLASGKFKVNKNRFTQSDFTAIFFSSLIVFLGPASMAMHATETEIGGGLDMLSMYLVASFSASYAMQRFYRWKNSTFTISFITIVIICELAGFYHGHLPIIDYSGNLIFGVFLFVAAIYELRNAYVRKISFDKKYGYMSLGLLLLAFFIWNIWKDGSPLCNPGSLIQGHAMWHLLDSAATYFLFRFYVSEHFDQ